MTWAAAAGTRVAPLLGREAHLLPGDLVRPENQATESTIGASYSVVPWVSGSSRVGLGFAEVHVRRFLDVAVAALLLAAGLVVLVLAARGAFRSAASFPLVFAVVVGVTGLLSVFVRRGRVPRKHTMLVLVAVALAVGAVVAHHGFLNQQRRAAEVVGMALLSTGPAPQIPYSHAANDGSDLANPIAFGERLTLLNFWATWCNPCREEMPVLERFWQEQRSQGLQVVGVTRRWSEPGETAERQEHVEIERFLAEAGVSYPVVVSDESTVAAYGVESWPTTVLIGPDGRAIGYGVGIDGADELLALAEELLREL